MIEIIPKPVEKEPLWLNILFYFSIVVLLAAITSYFILDNSIKNSFEVLQGLEKSLAEQRTEERIVLEEQLLDYEKKIHDFSSLINAHKKSSSFFSILEDLTHPKVQFSNINLEPEKLKGSLSGKADNFKVIGQQIYLFEKEPFIEKVDLNELFLGKEGIAKFVLVISLSPEIFK